MINTKTHGILDYLMGILLIASPWLFDFANGTAAPSIPVILGITTLVMSFFTNYELGVVKSISISTHLTIDALSGLFLAASPWLFNFDELVYLPHLILGLAEVVVVMITTRKRELKSTLSQQTKHSEAKAKEREPAEVE